MSLEVENYDWVDPDQLRVYGGETAGEHDSLELVVEDRTPVSGWCWSRSKRAIDLSIGILSLPVIVPVTLVMSAISAALYRCSPIFVQKRLGVGERPISVVKIRSLPPSFPEQQGKHQLDEQQLSRWSRFLRQSHFDELPQILNVLWGSMSIVGPRPMIPEVIELLEPHDRRVRALVKPGLTGPWQISTAGSLSLHECPFLDTEYVANANLKSDASIVVSTTAAALGRAPAQPRELMRQLRW